MNPHKLSCILLAFLSTILMAQKQDGWPTVAADVSQEGYKYAIDLGRIPNQDNPAASDMDWIRGAQFQTLTAQDLERWIKFTGTPNRRYFFRLKNIRAPKNFPVRATLFTSVKDRPDRIVQAPLIAENMLWMDEGFYFDTPGGRSEHTYFFRIEANYREIGSQTVSYDLDVHETAPLPKRGSLTNPIWLYDRYEDPIKGSWTMDVPAAMEAADYYGRPVIMYFTGTCWDSHSIRFEHQILGKQSPANEQLRLTYPVVIDLVEPAETGPSLLNDYMPMGYVLTNGLSESEADWRIKKNLKVQEDYKLPETAGLTYPTMVYCRVVRAGHNSYELQPVGRLGQEVRTAEQAREIMGELHTLFEKKHVEATQFRQTSTCVIPSQSATGTKTIMLGGPVNARWEKFTANANGNQGKSWFFQAQAQKAPKNALVSLKIYDENGRHVLAQTTAKLADAPNLLFNPESTKQENYWLNIEATKVDRLSEVTITFQQRQIPAELTLPQDTFYVTREDDAAKIPLNLIIHDDKVKNLTFQYRVVRGTGANAAPEDFFLPTDWQSVRWSDPHASKQLSVTIDVRDNVRDWNGTKYFKVDFRAANDGTCLVRSGLSATVNILARPAFLPPPEKKTIELFLGLATDLAFPVIPTAATGFQIQGELPEGLAFNGDRLNIPGNAALRLAGSPRKATEKPVTVTAILTKDGFGNDITPHAAKFTVNVRDVRIPAAGITAFTGIFSAKEGQKPTAHVTLLKNKEGMTVTLATATHQKPIVQNVSGWTGYDSKTKTLTLDLNLGNREKLNIAIREQGTGTATYEDARGERHTAAIKPVTQTPQDFQDSYNLALINEQKQAEAWVIMKVDQQGSATATIQLKDSLTQGTAQTIVCNDNGDGTAELLFPYKWNGQNQDGLLHLALRLIPKSRRNDGNNQDWIAADGDSTLTLGSQDLTLTPVGTVYDSSQSIISATGEQALIFDPEPIRDTKAILPMGIKIRENKDRSFSPIPGQGFLAANLQSLKVNAADGSFTATVKALIPQENRPASTVQLAVKGLLTPILTYDRLPMGWGFFAFPEGGREIYRLTLHPASAKGIQVLPKPVIAVETFDESMVTIAPRTGQAPLLCRHANGEQRIILAPAAQKAHSLPLIDGTAAWTFTALPTQSGQRESEAVSLPPITSKTVTLNPADPTSHLRPGWNLVSIPQHFLLSKEASFTTQSGKKLHSFQFNEEHQVMTVTDALKPGYAYWLYLTGKDLLTFTFKVMENTQASMPEPPHRWGLRACPTNIGISILWQFKNGQYSLVTDPSQLKANEGVWLYCP